MAFSSRRASQMMAPVAAPAVRNISTNVLPDRFRALFKFSEFNAIQSICFSTLYQTDANAVISSPTGSGKTVLFEIAILKALLSNSTGNFKIIYIAPTKALCYERLQDWSVRFSIVGLKCGSLTGDTLIEEVEIVKQSDIIVTTPEKWDSTTRRWSDYDRLMKLVRVVMIDEVHILKDLRGATLEAVISRMKYIAPHARFVALSATIPNANDIAEWLGGNSSSRSAALFTFGSEYRPVKLDIHVCGYQTRSTNTFQLDKLYDSKLPSVLDTYFEGRPIIIFCPTRKITVSTAKHLAKSWIRSQRLNTPTPAILCQDKELAELMKTQIAYHHAGLSLPDRLTVERSFADRRILIICCTSTLSVGVNLPAHLIIVKGTAAWIDNHTQEYTEFDLQQMIGRAGRPQFDTSGVAVIMTTDANRDKYEHLFGHEELVESCLHDHLVEHINAEICLKTITNIETAKEWLRSTFLYVRIKKNPSHYKIVVGKSLNSIEEYLDRLCYENITLLDQAGVIEVTGKENLTSTSYGKCMALFYIQFQTMKQFKDSSRGMNISDVLSLVSSAQEFKEIRLKQGETKLYKEINSGCSLRFPFKLSDISSYAEKVNLIIQFTLAHAEFPLYEGSQKHLSQFQSDKSMIWQHIRRLMKCIMECKLQERDAVSLRNAFELSRSVEAEIWDHSSNVLLQLDGVGPATLRKFVSHDVRTFSDLANMDCLQIERLISLNRTKGAKLLQDIEKIPKFSIILKKISEVREGSGIKISLQVTVFALNKTILKTFHRKLLTVGFLVELSTGELLDFRRVLMYQFKSSRQYVVCAVLETFESPVLSCRCTVACEELVGTESSQEINVSLQPDSIRYLKSKGQARRTESRKVDKRPGSGKPPFDLLDEYSLSDDLDEEELRELDSRLVKRDNGSPLDNSFSDISLDSDDKRELDSPIIKRPPEQVLAGEKKRLFIESVDSRPVRPVQPESLDRRKQNARGGNSPARSPFSAIDVNTSSSVWSPSVDHVGAASRVNTTDKCITGKLSFDVDAVSILDTPDTTVDQPATGPIHETGPNTSMDEYVFYVEDDGDGAENPARDPSSRLEDSLLEFVEIIE